MVDIADTKNPNNAAWLQRQLFFSVVLNLALQDTHDDHKFFDFF